MHRSGKVKRLEIDEQIRQTFSPDIPLVVHFDNKLLPDISKVTSERVPIVVSGKNVENILGIPKLPSATGFEMGNAVIRLIHEWSGVAEWVAALCFDTTSANTGVHAGAITVIQKEFQKHLLFLGCRHHILEILATSVFELFFPSSGPQIAIFARFKDFWPFINQENFVSINKHTPGYVIIENEHEWLENNKNDVVQFLRRLQNEIQPRRDYVEFLKLSLIALGDTDQNPGIKLSPPGAYHRARWMAKGIYCLKILCFRKEFKLSSYEIQSLKRICLFTTTIYVKMCFHATSSCNAPYNDLHLLQMLELYTEIDSEVALTALKKLKGQLWYLSEDLVGLAFFSNLVPPEEKAAMVEALQRPKSKKVPRRLEAKLVKFFRDKKLSDFVTEQTMNLFTVMKLDYTFLEADPQTWAEKDEYTKAKEVVSALKVVNDCAERQLNWQVISI